MPKAIRIYETGAPEVMKWEEVPMPKAGHKEVVVKHTAVGVNYIDVYFRTGLYAAELPFTPGMEGVGVVTEIGEECEYYEVGERVAYAGRPMGAYAEYRTVPESLLVKVPPKISDAQAAGLLLKGLTAHYLVRRTFMVAKHHTVLVHAAAGGVGLLLCQWAKHLGAKVIGTVGSEEKAALAKANGCDFTILYKTENVVEKVKEYTNGAKCHAVYDAIGKDTFMQSLDCLMHFGLLVSYGQASGKIPPFDISVLQEKGSLFLTRPTLMHYKADQAEYILSCNEIYDLVLKGKLKINVGQSYYLSDAASAHRDLESGKTTGSSVLMVG